MGNGAGGYTPLIQLLGEIGKAWDSGATVASCLGHGLRWTRHHGVAGMSRRAAEPNALRFHRLG